MYVHTHAHIYISSTLGSNYNIITPERPHGQIPMSKYIYFHSSLISYVCVYVCVYIACCNGEQLN